MIDVRRGRVLATLVAAALALLAVTAAPSATGAPTHGRIDTRLDAASCALLGRVWSEGVETTNPDKTSVGCRIDACVDPHAHIRALTGEEVCYFGSERTGPRYGTFVDSRICGALHRRWVPQVNMCASNPFRSTALIERDPACGDGTPYYLTFNETEGYFDECLSRARYRLLIDAARADGHNLRQEAVSRSVVDCGLRPDRVYVGDHCVPRSPQSHRTSSTLIEGESVLWRGQDELEALRPTWTADGLPGRQLADLGARIQHAIDTVGTPDSLIVALGTNPTPGFYRSDLIDDLGMLPPGTPVMFVLPYRAVGSPDTLASVARYRDWEHDMAGKFPATRCVADWPAFVQAHPGILVDGIHPRYDQEATYAKFVSDSWEMCQGQFAANAPH